jgi:hypothetical protein
MAIDIYRKKLLGLYEEKVDMPQGFAATVFNKKIVTFDTQKTNIDVIDVRADTANEVPGVNSAYNEITVDSFVTREQEPFDIKEKTSVNATMAQFQRMAGFDPFNSPDFIAQVANTIVKRWQILTDRTQRKYEAWCSELMQTGKIVSAIGGTYNPGISATHFPTVTNTWGTADATELDDIAALINILEPAGKGKIIDMLVFGQEAWNRFSSSEGNVVKTMDIRRVDLGNIAPGIAIPLGFSYVGRININGIWRMMFTYNAHYETVGGPVKYLTSDNMVMYSSAGRFESHFGIVKRLVPVDSRIRQWVPTSVNSAKAGIVFNTYGAVAPDGSAVDLFFQSRPLPVVLSHNSFGCITTTAP